VCRSIARVDPEIAVSTYLDPGNHDKTLSHRSSGALASVKRRTRVPNPHHMPRDRRFSLIFTNGTLRISHNLKTDERAPSVFTNPNQGLQACIAALSHVLKGFLLDGFLGTGHATFFGNTLLNLYIVGNVLDEKHIVRIIGGKARQEALLQTRRVRGEFTSGHVAVVPAACP